MPDDKPKVTLGSESVTPLPDDVLSRLGYKVGLRSFDDLLAGIPDPAQQGGRLAEKAPVSSHDPHADYNAIADRVYIEGWALALTFAAVDQALAHSWGMAAVCAAMSAFCQFVVIRWSAWVKAHPNNPALRSLNTIATDTRWWVATLMVFLVYLALSPYVEQQRWPFAAQFETARQTTVAAPAPEQTAPPSRRITIDATPSFLMDLYSGKMSSEGDRIFAPYVGKWIAVSGTVSNVTIGDSDSEVVTFVLTKEGAYRSIVMHFDKDWNDRLSVLSRDQKISAHCEIMKANDSYLYVRHCELNEK